MIYSTQQQNEIQARSPGSGKTRLGILEKYDGQKATWLNITAYELSFETVLSEMFLGVCFVLSLTLEEENKCILQAWEKRSHTSF